MDENIINDIEAKMEKTLSTYKADLGKSGRTGIFGSVGSYSSRLLRDPTPLQQVPHCSARGEIDDDSALGYNHYRRDEKALLKSELGLTPANDGKIIRIAIPA